MGVNILTPLDIHSPDLLHFKKAGFAKKTSLKFVCCLFSAQCRSRGGKHFSDVVQRFINMSSDLGVGCRAIISQGFNYVHNFSIIQCSHIFIVYEPFEKISHIAV
jgi:hypothetical protein